MRRFWILLAVLTAPAVAPAGTPDIPDDINARLARAKGQIAAEVATRQRAGQPASAPGVGRAAAVGTQAFGTGCSIAIGNIFEDKPRIGAPRRETTVIVTGDIIQAGNNCR
ncbi:hypothetical protein HLB44_00990 [Aquincola sp. S2]|uniref:Uncharacterized protein n=1 Tax=Pseudaquabacterium terrae TaxID=2732868 RepID=A0ABX2ECD6_9BURK|nr:hypothetical protein [Aquabacterium terrae]NRF65548.1 hypothetical protein [Aquabacterium terrae]